MPGKILRTAPNSNDKYKSLIKQNPSLKDKESVTDLKEEKVQEVSLPNDENSNTKKQFEITRPIKTKREKKGRTFMMYQDTYKILQRLKMDDNEEREIYEIIDEAILLYNNSKKN